MKNIILAIRSFFRKGNGNIIKVLSLGTGLAIGIVLIAKVCFETSYDGSYENKDRIYQITTGYSQQGSDNSFEYNGISGAIAPGFKLYVPGVEEATRYTFLFESDVFFTQDKKKIKGESRLCDSCFFKVFDRPILAGDPAKVLATSLNAMVSRSFAEKIEKMTDTTAIGQTIVNNEMTNIPFTIGGIYEDFPENGTFGDLDVIISIESYRKSSLENWMGNDRYRGYVLLAEGVNPDNLKPAMRKMQETYQNIEELEQEGNSLWYNLKPFATLHTDDPDVKSMNVLLSLIAFALIFTAIMNYILIVISSLVRRTKEVGVRKCYGAEGKDIRSIMLAETTLHLIISLIIAACLIFAFRGMIEELVGASLPALFNPTTIAILAAVCIIVYLVSGLIPSYLFMRIPVSTVFRNYKESKRRWKLALLFFQFTATAFMVTLLLIIGKQYEKMANDDTGYDYQNLVYVDFNGIRYTQVLQAMDQLRALPFVEQVEASAALPIWGSSGNNIRLAGDSRGDLFNIADQYGATPGFFDMMGFKLIEGHKPMLSREVAVSRSFIEKIKPFVDWSDGPVGKGVIVSEHSVGNMDEFTICGVYEDYRIGSITNQDPRASVRFADELEDTDKYMHYLQYLVIKVNNFNNNTIADISKVIKESMPNKDMEVLPYRDEIRNLYEPSRKFRDSVLIGGVVTLIIALIGLIGYINDETSRRSSEIAIRKINGAISPEILRLFTTDVLKISLPAVILGNVATYFVAAKWMEQFSEKIALSWWIFAVCGVAILAIILCVVTINCLRIANSNPVESLKTE